MSATPPTRRTTRSGVLAFAVVFAPAFVAIASWSIAMPRDSGPDEPSHVVHAAGVVRGEWVGTPIAVFPGFTSVRVPFAFSLSAGLAQEQCFQAPASTPASCQPAWPAATRSVSSPTYSGRYPPLYYAVVGLPTLVSSSVGAFVAMRLVSALVSALFLGLAGLVVGVWSRNRALRLGVLLAATPMALYAAAVVNPSGLEICSATCVWVSGVVLVREHAHDPPAGLLVVLAASAAVLALARPVSPLWLGVIGVALLGVSDTTAMLTLARGKSVQVALGAVGVLTALAVTWVLVAHAFDVQHGLVALPANASATDVLTASLRREGVWLQEMVGIFGSHETLAPLLTYLVWGLTVGVVAIAALVVGRARDRVVLVGLVATCLLVPIAVQFLHARDLGIVWQGRYTLPVAVGIPILAAAVLGESRLVPRWRTVELCVVVAIPIAGFLAFAEALRRYAVGVGGGVLFFLHPRWQPPGGVVLWLVVDLASTVGLAAALWRDADVTDQGAARDVVVVPSVQ